MKTYEIIKAHLEKLKQPLTETVDENSEPRAFFNAYKWTKEGKLGLVLIEKESVGILLKEGMTQEELLKELEKEISERGVLVRLK